jgi:hypothetical protein
MLLRRAGFEGGQQIYPEQDACPGICFLLSGEMRVSAFAPESPPGPSKNP